MRSEILKALPPPRDGTIRFKTDSIVFRDGEEITEPDYKSRVYGKDLTKTDMFLGWGREEKELFGLVIDCYDIGRVNGLRFPFVVSTTSRKAIIETDTGEYFLKEKPRYCCNPEALRLAADFQSYLASKADFITPIVFTKEGEPYSFIGSHIFLLTKYRRGRLFTGNESDIENAGDTLAQLHNLSMEYPHTTLYPKKLSFDESIVFVKMAASLSGTEEDPYRNFVLESFRKILMKNRVDTANNSQLIHIIIHGDFSPFNMVFNEGRIVAVNDFDNCGHHPRIRELGEAMMTFCDGINYAGNTSSYRRPISTRFDIAKAKVFFGAYSARIEQPLTQEELLTLPSEMKTLWVELMALGLVRGDFNFYDVSQALDFPDFVDENIKDVLK